MSDASKRMQASPSHSLLDGKVLLSVALKISPFLVAFDYTSAPTSSAHGIPLNAKLCTTSSNIVLSA